MIRTRWLRAGRYMVDSNSAQMRGEEVSDGTVDAPLVVGTDEAVARIVEGHIRHLLLAFLQRGDELLALSDGNARIAGAVRDQHRGGDAIDAMDRRDAREQRSVAF